MLRQEQGAGHAGAVRSPGRACLGRAARRADIPLARLTSLDGPMIPPLLRAGFNDPRINSDPAARPPRSGCYPFLMNNDVPPDGYGTSDEPDRNPAATFTMTPCCSPWRVRPPGLPYGTLGAVAPKAAICD